MTLPHSQRASTQRFLITGGTGFIGYQLIDSLLSAGHQITVLTRNITRATHLFKDQVRYINALTDTHVTESFDIIINLAGVPILGPRWTTKRRAKIWESRIDLTNMLVQWLANVTHKPKLLISASAVGYYGIQDRDDDTSLTEISPPQNRFTSTLCQAWEDAAHSANKYGVSVVCMRLGVVFGKQNALPMMLLPIKLCLGGRLGHGTQWLSWIHIDDVIQAIQHLLQRSENCLPIAPVYNLVAPEPVRQLTFTKIAARIYHRPALLPIPAFLVRALLGAQSELLLEGQRVIPQQLTMENFQFNYPTIEKALENLR